jgi:hypothetical protein
VLKCYNDGGHLENEADILLPSFLKGGAMGGNGWRYDEYALRS